MSCRELTLSVVWIIIVIQFTLYTFLFVRFFYFENIVLFWILLISFLILAGLAILCYWLSIVTDPGSPDEQINNYYDNIQQIRIRAKQEQALKKKYRMQQNHNHKDQKSKHNHNHNHNHNQKKIQYDQIATLNEISFCFKCEKVKQPRIHHCKMCQRCIIRMDHHCPFIGNCVGKYNHKYFLQFLFYSTLSSGMIFFTILIDIFSQIPAFTYLNFLGKFLLLTNALIAVGLMIPIGSLFISQILVIKSNLTTIESYIKDIYEKNPFYKQSFSEHMQQIFGNSNWFVPTPPFKYQRMTQNSNQF